MKKLFQKLIAKIIKKSVTDTVSNPELVILLLFARKQWPSAKILGISELGLEIRDHRLVSSGRITPSDTMNALRRELSDLP